jgi:release factor glutamine methyltransferase
MRELASTAPPTWASLLSPPGSSEVVLQRALAWSKRLRGLHRYDDFRLEHVRDATLLVTPSVFNPKLLRTGSFFAEQLDSNLVVPTAEVLDMGTGSGVCAIICARRARRVVAIDINPAAVECARLNALRNHVGHKVDVRQADLFSGVPGERFDLVLFNPPFLGGAPRDDRDRAWRAQDVAPRFAAGLGAHLTPDGCALVLLSSFGDPSEFLTQFRRHDLEISLLTRRRLIGERLAIFRVRPAGSCR